MSTSRRRFLATTGKATLAIGLAQLLPDHKLLAQQYGAIGFSQQPLPYAFNALEPVIDATTMELHYTKHAAAYAKALNEAIVAEKVATTTTIEQLLGNISKYSTKMRNNGGGHYNHELFWSTMQAPQANNIPYGKLAAAINASFGSFANFQTKFSDAAKARFGSGWAWLVLTAEKQLVITSTPNQDNPLMDVAEVKGLPLLGLDVWEHAYYLKYQNKRADYIQNWFQVIHWQQVAARYEAAL